MPKPIEDVTILKILREEWESRKTVLVEETKTNFNTVSPGLKLKSKTTGILYTVTQVSPGAVTVNSPEGTPSMLSNSTLESDFELA